MYRTVLVEVIDKAPEAQKELKVLKLCRNNVVYIKDFLKYILINNKNIEKKIIHSLCKICNY